MKIFTKLASALMVLPVVAALTACSDDEGKYVAPEKLTNAQVYFANDLPATVTLSKDEGKFTVALNRIKTDEALSVNLVTEQDANAPMQYSVPASVTFEEGQSVAEIEVTYNPDALEYDEEYEAVISIADSAYMTPYGYTQYAFTGVLPAPWANIGLATYRDDFMGSIFQSAGNQVYQVPMQKSLTQEGVYRLVNPYGAAYPLNTPEDYDATANHYMVIHAENPAQVWMEDMDTGLDWGYGELTVAWRSGGYGKLENGIITFPTQAFLQKMAEYNDGKWTFYGNANGLFALALPGYSLVFPDYSVTADYQGILTDKSGVSYAQVNVVFGEDVQKALAYVVEADADADAVADALAAGEVEGIELVNGVNNIALGDLTGALQVVVASVLDGEVAYSDVVKFEYYGSGSNNPWKSLGIGIWTEPLVSDSYTAAEAQEVEVEIRESTETPDLYRVMDPYGKNWYLASENLITPCAYIEIHAEEADGVYVLPQQIGVDLEDGKPLGLASLGGYYIAQDNPYAMVKEYGHVGRVRDGIIELPTYKYSWFDKEVVEDSEDDFTFQGILYYGSQMYYGMNGFEVVLPSAVSNSARAKARANGFARRMHLPAAALHLNKAATKLNRTLVNRKMVKASLNEKNLVK